MLPAFYPKSLNPIIFSKAFETFIFWSLLCEHIQQLGFAEFLKKYEKSQVQWIGQRFHSLQQAACVTGWESVQRFRTSNLFFGTRRVMSFPELCGRAGKFRKLRFLNNQLYLKDQEMTHYAKTQIVNSTLKNTSNQWRGTLKRCASYSSGNFKLIATTTFCKIANLYKIKHIISL